MTSSKVTFIWLLTFLLAKVWKADADCDPQYPKPTQTIAYAYSRTQNFDSYFSNTRCSWHFQAFLSSAIVEIVVLDFNSGQNSQCSTVYMEAFDGDSDSSPRLLKWCGGETPTINSTGGTMTVYLTTDSSYPDFRLKYRALTENNDFWILTTRSTRAPVTNEPVRYTPNTYRGQSASSYYTDSPLFSLILLPLAVFSAIIGFWARSRIRDSIRRSAIRKALSNMSAPGAVVRTTEVIDSSHPHFPPSTGLGGHLMPNGTVSQDPVLPPSFPAVTTQDCHPMPNGTVSQDPVLLPSFPAVTTQDCHLMPNGTVSQDPVLSPSFAALTTQDCHPMPNSALPLELAAPPPYWHVADSVADGPSNFCGRQHPNECPPYSNSATANNEWQNLEVTRSSRDQGEMSVGTQFLTLNDTNNGHKMSTDS